ncbi:PepSY domain-containing protein [Tardiphaga alba]|uniref:PepSY domain-containing protein n=2 Tax=Tardiphaga alba TaxID=340268 RepID=A0ABX8AF96_9BRAD|nr:PepSY domain-containing protein [Tardiphaga alba]
MRIWAGGAVAVASLWLAVSSGLAQQNPAMENPSVVQPKSMAPTTAPLSVGANSFSEGQARDLLVSRGFSDVSQLMNDSQGIWRGTAKNGTQRVRVSVDFKGNVSAQPE